MVRDAPVLALDEPTTGFDAASGEKVMATLRRLMGGRTTIVISHDLSTVREATEIVFLEEGRVAERGTTRTSCGSTAATPASTACTWPRGRR
jgi:ATP-binding cassette subfamily B protein